LVGKKREREVPQVEDGDRRKDSGRGGACFNLRQVLKKGEGGKHGRREKRGKKKGGRNATGNTKTRGHMWGFRGGFKVCGTQGTIRGVLWLSNMKKKRRYLNVTGLFLKRSGLLKAAKALSSRGTGWVGVSDPNVRRFKNGRKKQANRRGIHGSVENNESRQR